MPATRSRQYRDNHPEHDRLCAQVRSWYRSSMPAMGISIEQRRFGLYRSNTTNPAHARVTVGNIGPADVHTMLSEARDYFGNRDLDIWIEDRDANARLGPVLLAAGCTLGEATIYLAWVGVVPDSPGLPGVSIDPVNESRIKEYVTVKLKGFANSEDEPASETLAQEMALRKSELRGPGRFFIAKVGGESAAIIGYYGGSDILIFNLATRMPFRNRGLARLLLCDVLARAQEDRGSVVINTNPADTPINWYRRLGFTDEVYWHQTYLYPSAG